MNTDKITTFAGGGFGVTMLTTMVNWNALMHGDFTTLGYAICGILAVLWGWYSNKKGNVGDSTVSVGTPISKEAPNIEGTPESPTPSSISKSTQ